jgi:hypothetical protein
VKIVEFFMKVHERREHVLDRPLGPEDYTELLNIYDSHFSDRVDRVLKPLQTDGVKFVIEERLSKFLGKHRELLSNGMLCAPVLVIA